MVLTENVRNLIKTLWTKENLNMLESSHFLAKLIPLNKDHPETPTPQEIKPINSPASLT